MEKVEAIKRVVLAALASIGSAFAQTMGGWDVMLWVLTGFMITDYVTGVMVALLWHKSRKTESGGVDSRAGAKGLVRKMAIYMFVAMGAALDKLTGNDFLRDAVCLFYVANEGLSILENTAVMGVKYPQVIKDALEILQKNENAELPQGKGG